MRLLRLQISMRRMLTALAIATALTSAVLACFAAHHRWIRASVDADIAKSLQSLTKAFGPADAQSMMDIYKDTIDGRGPILDERRLPLAIDSAFRRTWRWVTPAFFAVSLAVTLKVSRRPRFTIRRLMLAIALIALLLLAWPWANRMAVLAHEYRVKADGHAKMAQRLAGLADEHSAYYKQSQMRYEDAVEQARRSGFNEALRTFEGFVATMKQRVEERPLQKKIDYHIALRSKYQRAARYPWLPVAPDPPDPK